MKVFVQIVNCDNGVYQTGMIDEPVSEGLEVQNAIKHFGVIYGEVIWINTSINIDIINNPILLTGYIEGTNKIINVIKL